MKRATATELYALAFGLFLGLCIWKFGNPVILDHKILAPVSPAELWQEPWPLHWAKWFLLPLALAGAVLTFKFGGFREPSNRWLWLPPLAWLGWQVFAAGHSVDSDLTTATLWQFSGCVACYFLGAFLLAKRGLLPWLLAGILAGFTLCLIRAVDQKFYEYPQSRQMLIEGERSGWTNYPPVTVAAMRRDGIIITTNGTELVNPLIMAKFEKGRVSGTMVYPNALAGLILLLWPVSLALAFNSTKRLKPAIRWLTIALTIFVGAAALIGSGSKFGLLISLGVAGLFLLRLNWAPRLKMVAVAVMLTFGLTVFAVRFHHYFSLGATSATARLDYWRAAVETTAANPLLGSGPGTFQRPYARIKTPESEMARLTHNDYLEQFSDSGIIGGLSYLAWIVLVFVTLKRRIWEHAGPIPFALFAGAIGWFVQGFGEFSLYIPALAWTAFTLLGLLVGLKPNQFDK